MEKILTGTPGTLSSIFSPNSSAIRSAWERVYNKYARLYKRSAFVHHFENEGIERSDMEEASENILALIKDYEEVERD
jgi:tubulin alpha